MTERSPSAERVEVGLRRVPGLDFDAPLPESDEALVGRIADEIRREGPMTFARFMELVLYDPERGYYATGRRGPGRRGDFLTAPEGHPIFGWAIAAHLESVWDALRRPTPFVIREHGAGTGALAAGILDGLHRSGSQLLGAVRYQAFDVGPARLNELRGRLEAMALAGYLDAPDDRPAAGAVLANELVDAIPVHLVEGGRDGELLERFVTLDDSRDAGAFGLTSAAPSTDALRHRLEDEGVRLAPGQRAEVRLEDATWFREAAAPLERGELLLIDYGYPAAELYQPSRGETLRAYHGHRVHDDPFVAIGRQDLTAHVDLTAVESAAEEAGLGKLGEARQSEFLAALGIGELLVGLQADPATTLESYLEARSALVRMLDPRATGAFRVLGFGRGLAPGTTIRGFATTA